MPHFAFARYNCTGKIDEVTSTAVWAMVEYATKTRIGTSNEVEEHPTSMRTLLAQTPSDPWSVNDRFKGVVGAKGDVAKVIEIKERTRQAGQQAS